MSLQILVKSLLFLIGGYQVLVIGYLPFITKKLDDNLFYTLLIFASSIGLYLFFTKIWERLLHKVEPKKSLIIGTTGIFVSSIFLIISFYTNGIECLLFFLFSRATYSVLCSLIFPFTQSFCVKTTGVKTGVIKNSIYLNYGRVLGIIGGLGLSFLPELIFAIICILSFILLAKTINNKEFVEPLLQREESNKKDSFYIIPCFFTCVTSFFLMSLIKKVEIIQLPWGLNNKSLFIILLISSLVVVFANQFISLKNIVANNRIINSCILISLMAITSFFFIEGLSSLIIFIILFSIVVGIVPIFYTRNIYNLNLSEKKEKIAARLSFSQTLGNSIGSFISAFVIKFFGVV